MSDYVSDKREQLKAYIAQAGHTQAAVAKEMDVSKTAISQFLSGTYPGDNRELAQRVGQFITQGTARKALAREPEFCPTVTNAKTILDLLSIIHISNDMCLIYGPAGCGKSSALRYYTEQTNSVIYVEADVTTNSPRCLLKLILSAMGEVPRGSTSDMMQHAVALLRDTNRLIIIDEAQHLTAKSFDAIRAINDKAHVGIAYAGNPSILRRMIDDGKRNYIEFDQVFSRIGYHLELKNRYSEQDITAIYKGFQLDKPCMKYLHRISRLQGGLRAMVKQYKLAANIADATCRALSVNILQEAESRMRIGGAA